MNQQDTEARNEAVEVRELLLSTPKRDSPFSEALAGSLPLQTMDWRDFERLCARLIEATYGHVTQAFRYGAFPQSQGGIDIVATSFASRKKILAECKRVQKINTGDIAAWTDRFIRGNELSSVERFILAVTASVESSTKRLDEWTKFSERLASCAVICELWDYSRIEELLRRQPELVCVFFGEDAAKRFCVRVTLASRWPSEFRAQYKQQSRNRNFVVLEDRFVRLELFVPAQHSPFVSAGLSFARQDLRGLSLSIDSKTIVSWMQWISNARPDSAAPFLPRDPTGDRWILQAPTARLQLEQSELRAMKWVLDQGWGVYIESARALDQVWRASRFPRGHDESSFTVQLYSMSADCWQASTRYMHEYDAGSGHSSAHIYDAVRGALKIYVPQPRAGLEAGYHLIAPVDRDNTSLWSDSVILHWEPISLSQDEKFLYSPQLAWDAEHSHGWIGESFRSAVTAYTRRKHGSLWKSLVASNENESMRTDSAGRTGRRMDVTAATEACAASWGQAGDEKPLLTA